jgi:ubiquinone/menaquinone biosynthesis C-methylase UbiE
VRVSEYDLHADTYDTRYADYRIDVPFYVEEARRAGSPVLELACGTGRVAIPVAQAGVEVVGIDSSPAMLHHFREQLPELPPVVGERITLYDADMRDFELGAERFSLVYCPFRAFLHLMSVEDQLATLHSVHRHLRPGGRLALNFFNPSVTHIARGLAGHGPTPQRIEEFAHPVSGHQVIVYITTKHDVAEQIIRHYRIEEELDEDGRVIQRTYKPLTLRWIYRFEFEHLLARCGFDVEALYGAFDRRPFTGDKDELIWIARKR